MPERPRPPLATFVYADLAPYGSTRIARAHAAGLAEAGWATRELTGGRRLLSNSEHEASREVVAAVQLASVVPAAARVVARRLRGERPDLVVLVQSPPRFRGRPVLRRIKRELHRAILRRADLVVAVSDQVGQRVRDLGVDDVVVVANAIDPPALDASDRSGHVRAAVDPVVVGAVGRLHRQKGFDLLLDALGAVVEQLDPQRTLRVRIAGGDVDGGKGVRDALETEATRLAVATGGRIEVELVGWVDDVPGFLAEADVFVLPSRWEGRSLAALEAMAVGVPAVLSDACGIEEFVDGVHGRRVDAHDRAALAAALVEVIDADDERRSAWTTAARELATDRTAAQVGAEFRQAVEAISTAPISSG